MLNVIILSEMKRAAVRRAVFEDLRSTGARAALIIDSADPRAPRGGSAIRAYAREGLACAVCDPLTEPLPDLSGFDMIHMSGGDPFRLLRALRSCDLADVVAAEAAERDIIVVGSSAGAMVMGEEVGHADILCSPAGLTDTRGLGWVTGRVMPHMDKKGPHADAMRARVASAPGDAWTLMGDGDVLRISPGPIAPASGPGA